MSNYRLKTTWLVMLRWIIWYMPTKNVSYFFLRRVINNLFYFALTLMYVWSTVCSVLSERFSQTLGKPCACRTSYIRRCIEQNQINWYIHCKGNINHWYLVTYIHLNTLVFMKYLIKLICESLITTETHAFEKTTKNCFIFFNVLMFYKKHARRICLENLT